MRKSIAGSAACLMALALLGADAEARIICKGEYQVVNGEEISTPYCNDNYLAAVARERGMKVTDEAVRNDPSVKERICLWIGRSQRVREFCNQYFDTGR
jgi:hypothetical protein